MVVKAILLWLKSVLADMIHSNHTYMVSEWTIFNNVYLLESPGMDCLSFALLFLDWKKVFGRVYHGYLTGSLRLFSFTSCFKLFLLVPPECLVKFNWMLMEPIPFRQGMCQDCQLSGQLYVIILKSYLCLFHKWIMGLVLRELAIRLVLSA